MIRDVVGPNASLRPCGASKKAWHCVPGPRDVPPDPEVRDAVRRIAPARPTYGTRRMAAQLSGDMGRPVNRKAVRRVFRALGWGAPARTKRIMSGPFPADPFGTVMVAYLTYI